MQVSSPLSQAAAHLTSRNATAISQKEADEKKNAVTARDYQDEVIREALQSSAGNGARGTQLDVTA